MAQSVIKLGSEAGDESMCQALLEIMEPEINEIRKSEVHKGQILGAVSVYRDLGLSEEDILKKLQEKYHLGVKEAESFLRADGI